MVRALIFAAVLTLLPTAAHAFDPLSIATISVIAFNTTLSWGAASAISFVANAALVAGLSYAAQALTTKRGGPASSSSAMPNSQEVRYSTRQSAPPKRVIYGTAHVGGALCFERTTA